MVITGTDANGVRIQVLVEDDLASEVSITQGVDIGLSVDYGPITNGFIEIDVGASAVGKQRITVDSPRPFEVILAVDFENSIMSYTPFFTTESGAVEFFLEPQGGKITFALMDVPEI